MVIVLSWFCQLALKAGSAMLNVSEATPAYAPAVLTVVEARSRCVCTKSSM